MSRSHFAPAAQRTPQFRSAKMMLLPENIGNFAFERASSGACLEKPGHNMPEGQVASRGQGWGPESTVSPPRCPGPRFADQVATVITA